LPNISNVSAADGSYTVTFTQIGLPSGTSWSVDFNGTTNSSIGNSIVFENLQPGNSNYTFLEAVGYTANVTQDQITIIDANVTIAVSFAQNNYTLTINKTGNGSVSVNGTTYTNPNQTLYHLNDSVTLNANASTNWSFNATTGWSGDGIPNANGTRLVVFTGNMTVNVTFTQNSTSSQYSLTIITVGQGTVSPENATYSSGSSVDLKAMNANGWVFSGWSGDATGTSNTTIIMNGNKTVTATFTLASTTTTYNVTFTQSGLPSGANWSVTLNSETQTSTRSSITFTGLSGSYWYTISLPSGYTATSLSGYSNLQEAKTISITAFSQASTASPLDNTWTGIIVTIIVLVAALLIFVVYRKIRPEKQKEE
jgi:uncharacterized repeat protein (TIGR02543 family)